MARQKLQPPPPISNGGLYCIVNVSALTVIVLIPLSIVGRPDRPPKSCKLLSCSSSAYQRRIRFDDDYNPYFSKITSCLYICSSVVMVVLNNRARVDPTYRKG